MEETVLAKIQANREFSLTAVQLKWDPPVSAGVKMVVLSGVKCKVANEMSTSSANLASKIAAYQAILTLVNKRPKKSFWDKKSG